MVNTPNQGQQPQQPQPPPQQPPQQPPQSPQGPQGPKMSMFAIISLVAALIGFPFAFLCFPISLLLDIGAIVLAIMGISEVNKSNGAVTGKGLAFGGIAAAVLGMLLALSMVVIAILLPYIQRM
jgi:hypothetical protein